MPGYELSLRTTLLLCRISSHTRSRRVDLAYDDCICCSKQTTRELPGFAISLRLSPGSLFSKHQ